MNYGHKVNKPVMKYGHKVNVSTSRYGHKVSKVKSSNKHMQPDQKDNTHSYLEKY
jgi:hypothetical protein